MIRNNRKTLLLTSLLTISPILAGLILWNQLPEKFAIHFSNNNGADGWGSKFFGVFGLPLILLALQLFVSLATLADPKRKNINARIGKMVFWIVPVISICVNIFLYSYNLGYDLDIGLWVSLMIGFLFIVIGNYLHKVKQNFTIGIRLPWTLTSEENWNRTHRMASWIFILGGIIMVINGFVQSYWLLFSILMVLFLIPCIYSFVLYKKGI